MRSQRRIAGEITGANRLAVFPLAKEVSVVGTFKGWSPRSDLLQLTGDRWQAQVPVEPGRHEYKFWVDGEWLPDPANPLLRVDDHGHTNSLLQVSRP